ncbi:hypothetical protein ACA910_004036 [Epithemia clementina (nom. ined.)]
MPYTTRSSSLVSNIASTSQKRSARSTSKGYDDEGLPAKKLHAKSRKRSSSKDDLRKKKQSPVRDVQANLTVPWFHIFTNGDEEYDKYMATEWSMEMRGDQQLFEMLSLEGAQSGLSWLTILRKREAYRKTFFGFNPEIVAQMTAEDVDRILSQEDKLSPQNLVVRHRGKIEAVINNAQCVLQMKKESLANSTTSDGVTSNVLDTFLWSFVDDKPILNYFAMPTTNTNGIPTKTLLQDFPNQSPESQAMSKALKKKGWKFVGPTTCYAFMQAVGMVIDHPLDTPEWHQAKKRLQQREKGYQDREKDGSV